MKKRFWLSLMLAASLAVVTACGSNNANSSGGSGDSSTNSGGVNQGAVTEEKVKIRIGVSPFQDTLLPIVGEEKGWFEEAGLDVTFETLAWNAVMPALASNSIDVAVYNTAGVISVHNRMEDAVFLYPWNIFTEGQALMGRPDQGFKTVAEFESEGMDRAAAVKASIEQIRGKTVITTMGSDMGKSVVEVTTNNGISPDEFDIIDMDPDQGLAAFLSGSGDMYLGGIPQRSRLEQEGYLTMMVGPDLAPVPINGWVTTQGFVDKNEEALLKLQNVMFRIIRYTDANMEEIATLITSKLNSETGSDMTNEQFEKFFREIEDFAGNAADVERDLLKEDGFAFWQKTWDNDNKYFYEVDNLIPEPVPYEVFKGLDFHEKYIAKYGANESGS